MSASVLDRLNARLAAKPAVEFNGLFADLEDARDAIEAAVALDARVKEMLSAPPAQAPEMGSGAGAHPDQIEAMEYLKHAQERLAVNSTSSAGDSLRSAIRLLTPFITP